MLGRFSLAALALALLATPDAPAAGPIRDRLVTARERVADRVEFLRPHLRPFERLTVPTAPVPVAPTVTTPKPPTPVVMPIPGVVGAVGAGIVGGPLLDRLKERLVLRVAREHAVDALVKSGYHGRKVTHAEAKRIVDRVDDETLLAGGRVVGALGDGKFLDSFQKFLAWLQSPEGQAAIKQLVALILQIAALFGDEQLPVGLRNAIEELVALLMLAA